MMRNKLKPILLVALGLVAHSALAADSTEALARTCNNCHGVNGVSAGGSMPSLGGQPEAYLKQIMLQWKTDERAAATMNRLIKGYSDEQIASLAKYFAAKPWVANVQKAGPDVMAKGKDATERCETCHGETGGKPDDELTPRLNGQAAMYLHLELDKYRDEAFKMTHKKMIKNARKMEEGDVGIAAKFYGSQSK
jgi:cytochrome subunit of sulfide dehydrogenase